MFVKRILFQQKMNDDVIIVEKIDKDECYS